VITIAEAQSHHCRLSIFRMRAQKDGSPVIGRVPSNMVVVTLQ
jgi:hypothetical protein